MPYLKHYKKNQHILNLVTRCKNSVGGDNYIFEICSSALEQCKQEKGIPHIPLFYLYSFVINVNVYMDHLGRDSNYMFDGFTFMNVRIKKLPKFMQLKSNDL